MGDECKSDWKALASKIQQRQAEGIIVSDYHIDAAGKLLDLDKQIVRKAFATLGVKVFPENRPAGALPLGTPSDTSEMLSLLLQISPRLSPLFRSIRPEWSEWLNGSTSCRLGNVVDDPEVTSLAKALLGLFDEADRCVDEALSQLKLKSFLRPRQRHILQASLQRSSQVPALLLNASIEIRFPSEKFSKANVGGVSISKTTRIRVGSEEALGFWGYYDSLFVIREDKNGGPYVRMDGNRYTLQAKKIYGLLSFIEAETKVKIDPLSEAFSEQEASMACTACQMTDMSIELLKTAVTAVSTSDDDRIRHGTGHSQEDIFHIRSGKVLRVPDIVAWPVSEGEVADVVALAKDNQWCIVPFGGGTNVSHATRCPSIVVEPRPIVSLDMRKMKRILWVDEENGLAHVEAGITGRQLEEEMARRGYTMGHEPDSIEFSTLGGWIATKASGMKRNKYGNIEDIVKAVRVAGPDGLLRHGQDDGRHVWGRESCGMDLCSLALGSEGCLGVITSAVVRIWPVAEVKDYDSILLPDFEGGLCFVREISKLGAHVPVSVRLLDNEHFRLGLALRPDPSSAVASLLKSCFGAFIKWKVGFEPKRVVCTTIAYEGTHKEVADQKRAISRIGDRHGGVRLGSAVGKAGYEMTFMIAYIRDFAMTYHFLGESFETFAPWSNVEAIIAKTKAKIREEHASRCLPGEPFIGCRVTQLYHEGACLYFYFCMNFENVPDASAVYSEIEHAARSEVLANGGSVSHHHGIGKLRASFLKEVDSVPLQDAMQSIKKGIDPENVFGARNGAFAFSP
jgi:alkyldihydroxyacetonephosphate synthase